MSMNDRFGNDTGDFSMGSSVPDNSRCDVSMPGKLSVCRDVTNYANHHYPSDVICTYKSTDAMSCSGGGNPGYLYQCVFE